MTEEAFLTALAQTGAFEFDWTWGPEGQYVGMCNETEWDAFDRAYAEAVADAQEIAKDMMDEARRYYAQGDFDRTLYALRAAAHAERKFGDAPTYRPMIDYLRPLTED